MAPCSVFCLDKMSLLRLCVNRHQYCSVTSYHLLHHKFPRGWGVDSLVISKGKGVRDISLVGLTSSPMQSFPLPALGSSSYLTTCFRGASTCQWPSWACSFHGLRWAALPTMKRRAFSFPDSCTPMSTQKGHKPGSAIISHVHAVVEDPAARSQQSDSKRYRAQT